MTTKQNQTCDRFYKNTCGVCGNNDINQYFNVDTNFVDYNGIYLSLREVSVDALAFEVNKFVS